MVTVSASETMSRAGMKNRLGSRRSERQSRFARLIFDAAGTAMTDDLPSDDVLHRVISRRHTAVGQLADFQGGPSRTGGNDEHPAPVLYPTDSRPCRHSKLVRDVRRSFC